MVFVKSLFTLGLFIPTLRTDLFLTSHISPSWKPSWTEGTHTIVLFHCREYISDFSHLNSCEAVCVGVLACTLMCSEVFVVQDDEENKSPGFQTVPMPWLIIHLIVQVFAHTLPPREPRVS